MLLEKAAHVGSAWRQHYDRLHLHTPARHSSLPRLAMPADYPTYPSRQQVVDYLDAYAAKFDIQATLGTKVERIERDAAAWKVTTPDGMLRADSVVLCTGYNNVPLVPDWPGKQRFEGAAMHSSAYRSGERFAGKRVLVVGAGNSGAEIALDLLEHGARPTLCIRGPIHVVARDLGPVPALNVAIAMQPLPDVLRSAVMRAASLARYGDLSRWGIRRPRDGMLAQIRRGRIPLIDVGTIGAIRRGQIDVVPGIAEFGPRSVRFANGEQREVDAVVFATGYRTGLPDLLPGLRSSFDAKGLPASAPCLAEAPGLYFVGFENSETGLLRAIARCAAQVAERIGLFHP